MKTQICFGMCVVAGFLMAMRLGCQSAIAQSPPATQPANYLVVLAEGLPGILKKQISDQIGKWSTTAPAGSRMVVVGGPNHTPIADMTLKGGDAIKRFRDIALRREIQKVAAYLDHGPVVGEALQVGFPQLAHTYWTKLGSAKNVRIVLAGTPEYYDPKYPFWSFRDFTFPADQSIFEKRSNFPLINRVYKPIPGDVSVVLLTPDQWGSSDRHRNSITRFLRLAFQESIGGQIVQVTNTPRNMLGAIENSFEPVQKDGHPLVGTWTITRNAHIEERDDNRFDGLRAKEQPTIGGSYLPNVLPRESANTEGPSRHEPTSPATSPATPPVTSPVTPPVHSPLQATTTPPALSPSQSPLPSQSLPDSSASEAPRTNSQPLPADSQATSDSLSPTTQRSSETQPSTDGTPPVRESMPVVQASDADKPEPSPLATNHMPEKTTNAAAVPETQGGSSSNNPITEGFYPAPPEPPHAGSVLDQWPDAFRQSVLARLQSHPRALLVRIVWTSECPHAEVDLKGPQYVQHNHPRQSGSGEMETTEWGMVVSPSTTHATIHLVRTHHDVSVRLQIIEWPSLHSRETQLDFTQPGHDGKQYWSQRRMVNLQHLMAGTKR